MKVKTANLYECAEELDLPVKWLKQAAIEGKVPCLKINSRNLRFNVEAVSKSLAALAERRTLPSKHKNRMAILVGRYERIP